MKQYIYTRVSTESQSTESQSLVLQKLYPKAEIIKEYRSSMKRRPKLEILLEKLEKGDMLIIAALDRLGRKTTEILNLIENLNSRGIILFSGKEGVNYSTPTGKLVTQILISVSEMERNLISERTKAGLKAAKARGAKIGRPKKISDETIKRGIKLIDSGLSMREAGKKLGICYSSLSKKLKNKKSYYR